MHHPSPIPSFRRRRPVAGLGVLLVVAGLGVGACGTVSQLTTGQAIDHAVYRLGTQSSLSVTVSLASPSGAARQTGATPKALAGGSLFFSETTGQGEALDSTQAAKDPANTFDVALKIGSDQPLEVRYVNQALYLHARLDQLAGDLGTGSAGSASSLNGMLQQGAAAIPGLSALAQGDWVEISPAALQSLAGLLGQSSGSSGGGGSQAVDQIGSSLARLGTDALDAAKANSTFQNLGAQGTRTEYAATVDVHGFLTQLHSSVQKDLSALPGGLGSKAAGALSQGTADLPAHQKVVADLYVRNNALDELDVNLDQFAGGDQASAPGTLKITFGPAAPATPPSGAVALDLSNLPGLILGMMQGHTGGGGGAGSSN